MSSLPDVCGLPVVTSSWRAIRSLDEAYTEVKPSVVVVLWMGVCTCDVYGKQEEQASGNVSARAARCALT